MPWALLPFSYFRMSPCFVPRRPLSIRAGHVGTVGENGERLLLRFQLSRLLQFDPYRLIDELAAAVVGGDNDGPFRVSGVVLGDGADALVWVCNLGDAALLREHFDALGRLAFGEMLDRF